MKSRTGVEESKREEPNAVKGEPSLANSRKNSGEPRLMKSKTNVGDPNREEPNTVKGDPILANSLESRGEPR